MVWLNWLTEHWFDLIQTTGVVGGLLFTGFALNADAKAKRASNLLNITQQHRELWSLLYSEPELFRILRSDANIASEPVTPKEEQFVRFIILHLNASFQADKAGVYNEPSGVNADTKSFFALPIPPAVWTARKQFCDADFVNFVETARKVAA